LTAGAYKSCLPLFVFWSTMPNSSITVLRTVEWAKRFIFRRPVNNGNFVEPALTSANMILQTILGPPFIWRWNRAVIGFVTNPGQQDYTIFNWAASTYVSVGYTLVDNFGNSQQVTTAGTTETPNPPTWNQTVGGVTADGTAVWTNKGSIVVGNYSQSYQFGWIENASIREQNPSTCAYTWKPLSPKIDLALDSATARPNFIAAEFDNGNNNTTFRLMPVPDGSYPVAITIQQKPSIITSVNSTWAPIPDEYSRLYSWGLLALLALFADDQQKFQFANQKFIANLLSTSEGLSQSEANVALNNWYAITGQPTIHANNLAQGFKGRENL
jgi:hypothetical protein